MTLVLHSPKLTFATATVGTTKLVPTSAIKTINFLMAASLVGHKLCENTIYAQIKFGHRPTQNRPLRVKTSQHPSTFQRKF
jgi:hypothetical protein